MDFRVLALGLLLLLSPLFVYANDQLDELTELVYQFPAQAFTQISAIEKQQTTSGASDIDKLRLNILKCQNLLQLEENEAAVNLAQLGEASAKQLMLDQARPYFLICQADAHLNHNNFQIALPLLDSAILLARRYQQPQALVEALRLRGQFDTHTDNFSSAIEDLRLAIDIYPDIHTQSQNWIWPPQAYINSDMSNLLYATNNLPQAIYYANLALQSPDAKGKVLHFSLLNFAKISLENQDIEYSDQLEKQAKSLLPEIDTPLELAYSYAILASIALKKGRIDVAEEYISISMGTFKQQNQSLSIMRATRLLAQIRFAQHQDEAALPLMRSAIEQGEKLEQYTELAYFYTIMAEYYAKNDDYKQAYEYSLKRHNASELANQKMNNARILQFKARLNQQDLLHDPNPASAPSLLSELKQNWGYTVFFLLLMSLLGAIIWYLIDKQNRRVPTQDIHNDTTSPQAQLDHALHTAKQAAYPLSLLLIDASQIRQVDFPPLLDALQHKLREQDKLIRYAMDEIVIALPHTSSKGAQRVASQLTECIQPWQQFSKVMIGIAALQQFDTLESLLKRASINLLGKSKNTDPPKTTEKVQ